ncbi:MAG: hypothetical protein RBS09_06820 [Anaerolineaceae bacterium]|jgi:hypothetical protein|nr:hypothetical protein [Anaerolineaceae bacterium]
MKTQKILISGMLLLTLLLGACAPAVEPVEPMPDDSPSVPYPVEDDQEPDQAYPIEESPAQPDSSDASGSVAYITDPVASQDDLLDHAEDMNEFALELYQKLAGKMET